MTLSKLADAGAELASAVLRGADMFDEQHALTDRKGYLNASEADGCMRKVFYEQRAEASAKSGGFARRGSHGELYLLERLRLANRPVILGGDEQERVVDDERKLAATPDGFWVMENGDLLYVEFKTIDPRANRKNLPKTNHVTQVQIGMELLDEVREEFPELGTGELVGGVILYMNASDFDELTPCPVERKRDVLDVYEKRGKRALNAKLPGRLPQEGKQNGLCQYCPFTEQCGVDTVEQVADKGTSSKSGRGNKGSGLDAAVVAYTTARAAENAAKEEKEEAAAEIKQEMQRRKVSTLQIGDQTVTLSATKGRTTTDTKAMEKDGIDLSKYQKTGAPGTRLTVA